MRRVSDNNNISQLFGDSFSVSQQHPSWDPCSHYSMVWIVTGTTDLATSSPILWRPKLRSRILKRSGAAEARGRRE